MRKGQIESGGTAYGQIEMLAGDEIVWQSYVFSIEVQKSLRPQGCGTGSCWAYLEEIERMLQQKASMEDLEAYIAMYGGARLVYGETMEQFPAQGIQNALYLDKANCALYYWSADEGAYKRLSADA